MGGYKKTKIKNKNERNFNGIVVQVSAISAMVLSSELVFSNYLSTERYDLNFDNIATILPSQQSIQNYVRKVATHKVIINGRKMMQSKAVYIATDHGGGVLVKMAFLGDPIEKKVVKINLDFDKSGHTAVDGGVAIKHSISKYLIENEESSFKFKEWFIRLWWWVYKCCYEKMLT